MKHEPHLILVGDIGGTNARFALADISDRTRPTISALKHLPSAQFASLNDALAAYLAETVPGNTPDQAVLAVAGPVTNGEAILTNLPWEVSETALTKLGFARVRLINDFRALAASIASLGKDDLEPIGPTLPRVPDATIALVGAGTGLGAAALVREPGKTIALAGEGGHIGFSPEDAREQAIHGVLMRRFGRVSVERIASGPGLVNLYEALCTLENTPSAFDDPHLIVDAAMKKDPLAHEAIEKFCAIFGAAAGDIALTFGARGGVLIAGGFSEAMMEFLKKGPFRTRFEGKGRLAHLVREIPTHMIRRPDAALLGCACFALEEG